MTGSRILLTLPVALVLVLCLAPMGMGFLIEQTYGSVIESVRENPQNAFSISGEFDQGLWSSSSVTRIEWPTGESVELDQDWIHGPVPLGELFRGRSPLDWVFAVVEATLDSQSESWPQVAASEEGRPLLESGARIYFDRSVHVHFSFAPMEHGDSSLTSEGVWGEGRITSGPEARVQGDIRFGRTTLGGLGQLAWDGAVLSLDRRLDDQGLTNLDLSLDVGELQFFQSTFEKAEFGMVFRRVDPSATQALSTALDGLDGSALSEEERLAARDQILAEQLPIVLRGSPEIELSRLALRSPHNELEIGARVAVDGSVPELLSNPMFALGLVQAEARVAASRSLVEPLLDLYLAGQMAQTEQAEGLSEADLAEMAAFMREATLGALIAGKRLVVEEDQFRADLEFDGGVLILNGEMMDPTQLSNPLSSM